MRATAATRAAILNRAVEAICEAQAGLRMYSEREEDERLAEVGVGLARQMARVNERAEVLLAHAR